MKQIVGDSVMGWWSSLDAVARTAIIPAAIALLGVSLSVFISALVASRSAYLTTVTAERSKWIDKLRTNIAELLGVLAHIHTRHTTTGQDSYRDSSAHFEDRKKANTLLATITLQLNPNGMIDNNMVRVMLRAAVEADKTLTPTLFRTAEIALIGHSRFLLKEEWEKIKDESRWTILGLFNRVRRCQRANDYREFCATRDAFLDEEVERPDMARTGWFGADRIRITLEVASIGFAVLGAAFWFLSAWGDLPLAPGAAIGGTLPSDPFNIALAHSASMNRWASIMTALSVLCTAGATVTRMRQRFGSSHG